MRKRKITYDYTILLERIEQVFDTQIAFGKAMNISEATISKKLTNKSDWRQDEIMAACKVLGIKKEFISEIFFSEKDPSIKENFFYD